MWNSIDITDGLIERAMALSGLTTNSDVVNAALREFVERRERKDLRELFGEIQFSEGYNYKTERGGCNNDGKLHND